MRQVHPAVGDGTRYSHAACEGVIALERDIFLRIVEASQSIKRHHDFHLWLQGEIQHFICHEVLISAYGNFETWQLKLDVISSLPGVRTQLLEQCDINDILKALFDRWAKDGRQPFVLQSLDGLASKDVKCQCPLHTAARSTKSLLVHGARDERGGCDSLFVALHTTAVTKGCMSGCFSSVPCLLMDSLFTQIDFASRKLASLPSAETTASAFRKGDPFGLSEREREILEWICKGKTNFETAIILNISSFTVKNHVQRILRKIGAHNRVQAATIYRERIANPANGWRR
jgi:transcriptional regulator EpsA